MSAHSNPDLRAIKQAYEYIMTLELSSDNALWQLLHILIWHKGIDRVGWILENKVLIEEIIKFDCDEALPTEIMDRYWESVRQYKVLDR